MLLKSLIVLFLCHYKIFAISIALNCACPEKLDIYVIATSTNSALFLRLFHLANLAPS